MTTQGIGASVKRKEDRRFLLGKGQYTDDIVCPIRPTPVAARPRRITRSDTAASACRACSRCSRRHGPPASRHAVQLQ
jgi:CO/xanthine dehydrogenase Mo-binding subunit